MGGNIWDNDQGRCGHVSDDELKRAERNGADRVVTRDSGGRRNGTVCTKRARKAADRGNTIRRRGRGWGP